MRRSELVKAIVEKEIEIQHQIKRFESYPKGTFTRSQLEPLYAELNEMNSKLLKMEGQH